MSDKYAILVTMEHAAPADRGRMTKALTLARDLQDAGKEIRLVFGGKGVEWLPELTAADRSAQHPFIGAYGDVFDAVRPHVEACNFCAIRFGVRDAIESADVPIRGEGRDHMKLSALLLDGFELITF